MTDRKGLTFIARAGREFELLGKARLGEGCAASMAFADGRIYMRGDKHVFCIGKR